MHQTTNMVHYILGEMTDRMQRLEAEVHELRHPAPPVAAPVEVVAPADEDEEDEEDDTGL